MPVDAGVLALVRASMGACKLAGGHDVVGNDECAYSFDTPYCPTGLYVNLKTLRGVGDAYVLADAGKSGCTLYAHHMWRKVPKPSKPAEEAAAPTTIGVGVEGGFATNDEKYDIVKTRSLAVVKDGAVVKVALDEADLPMHVTNAATAALDAAGSRDIGAERAWALTDKPLEPSKYADALPQIAPESDRKALSPDPSEWRCEFSGATENLWLNLSTGYVGGGRDQSAWGGPAGSNGALIHYKVTGKRFPLVVKLGTISGATGTAEVYSYAEDEDRLVIDPKLADHLAFWGINALQMEKTEKTTAELEVDANAKFEWSAIAEEGKRLQRRTGAGFIGLHNLGNSCYVNSVLQLLSKVDEIGRRYSGGGLAARALALSSADDKPTLDVLGQFSKVVDALLSDRYAVPAAWLAAEERTEEVLDADAATQAAAATLAPRSLRALVGAGHPEFSTPRQQDAAEYLAHLLETLRRAEHGAFDSGRLDAAATLGNLSAAAAAGASSSPGYGPGDRLAREPTSQLFAFNLVERIECAASKLPRYATTPQLMLEVPLPTFLVENERARDDADARDEPEDKRTRLDDTAKTTVSLDACLAQWAAEDRIDGFFSTATGERGAATRTQRLASSPRYLLLKLGRYYVSKTWEAKKVDVFIDMPLTLDVSALRAPTRDPNEQTLPEEAQAPAPAAAEPLVPDELIVAQLLSMGFDQNGCRRACIATANAGPEQAMEWVFAHMGDADFSEPLTAESAASSGGGGGESALEAGPDPEKVVQLTSMGFGKRHAEAALKACDGNTERATDWIFSHMDELDGAAAAVFDAAPTETSKAPADLDDGGSNYELVGFVSHIGKNTGCGHFVAHMKQPDGSFVLFNDHKVATSKTPPLNRGYIYLYKRLD